MRAFVLGALLFVGAAAMNAYPGISFAVSTMIAPSNLRATSIAIFTVAGNLIGYALGPPILGARALGGLASIGSSLLGFETDATAGALTNDRYHDTLKTRMAALRAAIKA